MYASYPNANHGATFFIYRHHWLIYGLNVGKPSLSPGILGILIAVFHVFLTRVQDETITIVQESEQHIYIHICMYIYIYIHMYVIL